MGANHTQSHYSTNSSPIFVQLFHTLTFHSPHLSGILFVSSQVTVLWFQPHVADRLVCVNLLPQAWVSIRQRHQVVRSLPETSIAENCKYLRSIVLFHTSNTTVLPLDMDRAVQTRRATQDIGTRRDPAAQLLGLLEVLDRGHLRESEVATVPAVVPEGEGAVQLDEGVVVGEEDVGGEPEQVGRVGAEVGHDLDEFGKEDPEEEGVEEEGLVGGGNVEVASGESPVFAG